MKLHNKQRRVCGQHWTPALDHLGVGKRAPECELLKTRSEQALQWQ
jgi:hypothetical protein